MSVEIDGNLYYKTLEACRETGISRATLFRWLKAGILEKYHKNHRGWRLFTEEDLKIIRAEASKIEVNETFCEDKHGKGSNS